MPRDCKVSRTKLGEHIALLSSCPRARATSSAGSEISSLDKSLKKMFGQSGTDCGQVLSE